MIRLFGRITRVEYSVHSNGMFSVLFAAISSTIHRHPAAAMSPAGMMSLWECVRFCTEFVGNDEFLGSHVPAEKYYWIVNNSVTSIELFLVKSIACLATFIDELVK